MSLLGEVGCWKLDTGWGTGDMAIVKIGDFVQVWWEAFGGVTPSCPVSPGVFIFPFWRIPHTANSCWMSKWKGHCNKLRNKKFLKTWSHFQWNYLLGRQWKIWFHKAPPGSIHLSHWCSYHVRVSVMLDTHPFSQPPLVPHTQTDRRGLDKERLLHQLALEFRIETLTIHNIS